MERAFIVTERPCLAASSRALRYASAFTLVELLVAMSVMALLVLMIAQLFNAAQGVITLGDKRISADAQARGLLDRIAIDFGRIVQRADVSYYLKSSAIPQVGNDQMAFYSEVPGYYPSSGSQSPVSLCAYRVNSGTVRTERMGKGLLWNGVSTSETPVVFLPLTIAGTWPKATNMSAEDDYEPIGPLVFRFEYYYVLKGQDAARPGILSDTPWDTRVAGHTSESGLQDVAAVCVAIAILDPKSRVLVSDAQLATLGGQMQDFSASMKTGELEAAWNAKISTSGLPLVARSAMRVYSRAFQLSPANP